MSLPKIDDHVLLLQLERSVEKLSDDVEAAVDADQFADIDHDHDEYAWDSHEHDYADTDDVNQLRERLTEASDLIADLAEANAALTARVGELENRLAHLIDTLRGI